MNMTGRAFVVLVLIGSLAACGSDDRSTELVNAPTSAVSESVPTPDASTSSTPGVADPVPATGELTAALLTPADLPHEWRNREVITDRREIYGPSGACSPTGDEHRDWSVEQTMQSAAGTTEDRSGVVIFGQWLMSGEPEQMRARFDEYKTAIEACDGAERDSIELGRTWYEIVQVPPVGVARIGYSTRSEGFEVADGVEGFEDGHVAFVLDGNVLMGIAVEEFREVSLDPLVTQEEFNGIVTTAAQHLPG